MVTENLEINKVILDVQAGTVTIVPNGLDIPEQVYAFKDSDEWFGITDLTGNDILFGNIWWDEQWNFQYVDYEDNGKGKLQAGSDYRNVEIEFVNGDQTPFTELSWVEMPNPDPRTELEQEIYDTISNIIQDDYNNRGKVLRSDHRAKLKSLKLKLSWPYRKEKNQGIKS